LRKSQLNLRGIFGVKKILLTQGFVAIVDNNFVPPGKYHTHQVRRRIYAIRNRRREDGSWTNRLLHQDVLDLPFQNPPQVDHIDGNGLNNRRSNLRLVTNAENQRAKQRKRLGCSSQFRGVSWDKVNRNWEAHIKVSGKKYRVGRFNNEIDAAKARDRKAIELFGPIAHLNFQ